MKKLVRNGLLITLTLVILTACGGSGGGGDQPVQPPAQPSANTWDQMVWDQAQWK